jgi:hypothetical protein
MCKKNSLLVISDHIQRRSNGHGSLKLLVFHINPEKFTLGAKIKKYAEFHFLQNFMTINYRKTRTWYKCG